MSPHLQSILNFIEQSNSLSADEKSSILKSLKDANKELEITVFKLDRTEKVKKTTGILLEETIAELEQKRKAVEAQNRELEIEAALERVRAVAMGMKQQADMLEICKAIALQLALLNVKEIRNVQTAIFYEEKGTYMNYEYYAKHDKTCITETSYTNHEIHQSFANQMLKGNGEFYITHIKGDAIKDWIAYQKTTNVFIDTFLETANSLTYHWFSLGTVALGISTYEPLNEEDINLFKRFLKVFELSYTRYLDIEKAEAQAREAQIEAALERVRARSLAMHNTSELQEVIHTLHKELLNLNIAIHGGSFIAINSDIETTLRCWGSGGTADTSEEIHLPYYDKPFCTHLINKIKNGPGFFTEEYTQEEKKDFFTFLFKHEPWSKLDPKQQEETLLSPGGYTRSCCVSQHTSIFIINHFGEKFSAADNDILQRFAKIFEQAYTRFLDLLKAEAQTREAQIEAALERVRSKAMMMQKSDDLSGAVVIVFEELRKLNIGLLRCGIGILHKEKRTADVFSTTITDTDCIMQVSGDEPMDIHPLLHNAFEAFLKHEDYEHVLEGEDLNKYYRSLTRGNFHLPESQLVTTADESDCQYYFMAVFSFGGLFAFSNKFITGEAKKIMRRFAYVFEQTYTRFLDIQKAEAQAKEAQVEAALERVRSRTLAMQRSDELAETAAVLFRQLILLGIEPNRLYICIIKEDNGLAEFWITDEDGSRVSTAYEDNLNNNISFKKMLDGWKQQNKSLVIDMHDEELQTYFSYLTTIHVPFKGGLSQKRRLQYIAYFSKGFIGMASPDEQSFGTLQLLERFAYVFNLTFTRFNDLQIAEVHAVQAERDLIEIKAARKKAEDALTELQATQKQLIQSEKMASLGELTAGIAHEIQNPLNFVNNFSEVSNEMLEELQAERCKLQAERNEALEDEIINDIKQNLEKINHHGKRADAIVKGMLQHSRKSEGQKEPTDINALCDEYIRLSYHGLRAKDKSFNADFKTEFDESIGKINIIPQDIGRVLLNLFNNAFYAVNEKLQSASGGHKPQAESSTYVPTVTLVTKKLTNKIEIQVKDNANGIPQNIIEKIFQPFFTTKPTGQGTGLGLSLAYDIIKAHGGEIKVETKEGEGTTFIIQLPSNL